MYFSVSKKNGLFIIFLGLIFLFTSLFSFNVNAMELEKHEEPSIVELTQDEINTLLQNYYNENQSLLNESISDFATAIASLSEKKLSIQAIWSVFLSLHGFVSHYICCEQTFAEVEGLANGHVDFLLKALSRCNRP